MPTETAMVTGTATETDPRDLTPSRPSRPTRTDRSTSYDHARYRGDGIRREPPDASPGGPRRARARSHPRPLPQFDPEFKLRHKNIRCTGGSFRRAGHWRPAES